MPPDHMDAQRLLLLRNVEIERVRRRDCIKDQPRAVGRDIADQAVDHIAPVVEVDHAAQEPFVAVAAFAGAWFGLC